jgi:hypothetical protein
MKFELQTLEEYTDEALLSELRRVADTLSEQPLTRERFNSLARVHSSTISKRFGSWKAALDKAEISEETAPRVRVISREDVIQALRTFAAENPGVSVTVDTISERLGVHKTTLSGRYGDWKTLLSEVGIAPVPFGRRYTDEECFENILELWTHYGRQPHFGELKHSPSTVGPKAYIRRWGGWRAALSAFVKQVNDLNATFVEPVEVKSNKDSEIAEASEALAPRSISMAMRYKILSRDKFRCVICGASPAKDVGVELHIDHIHPWSRGGKNVEENLRTLCSKCNLGKGAKLEGTDSIDRKI